MRLLLLTYLLIVFHQLYGQDDRDFYGSNTYFETATINDSVFNLYKNRDLIIDSKSASLSLSIKDSVIQFTNTLDKTDNNIFHQGVYSIRVKTKGYHFECLDQSNYLYSVDNLQITDVKANTIQVKAQYKIFHIRKKKNKLLSSEDVVVEFNKDDLQGVLFGTKYTYDPKDDIKKAKRKDIAKAVFYSAVISGGLGYAVYWWFFLRDP